jgi:hypothetical protein
VRNLSELLKINYQLTNQTASIIRRANITSWF